jgi:ubiquinone/menaquinone biosynthesis C-methylase UbiE
LNRPFVTKHREVLLQQAGGSVLEIGFGTGLNLAHYPSHVRRLTVVDPNTGAHRLAKRRIEQAGIDIDHHVLKSESLPFSDNTFDCIVSTFTLCSIDEVEKAVREVRRVLKPGGRFLFLEHGLSPEENVRRWQRRLNWIQKRLGDGCRLDRDIKALVATAPFSSLDCREFYLEKSPKTHGYVYSGVAIK